MKELITRAQADAILWVVGALGLIAAPLAAWIARRRGENPVKFALACGGPLILAAIMWHVYNAIEDRLGLDSVAALAINFGIFVVLGGVIGAVWTLVYGRSAPETPTSNAVVSSSDVQ